MHAEVGEKHNRLAVRRPERAIDVVLVDLADEHARRAAAGRGKEHTAVVIVLEPRVRAGDEEYLRPVRRHRRVVLLHGVLRHLDGAGTVGIHRPDFAVGARSEQRRRLAVQRNRAAVVRHRVIGDREVAAGQPRFGAGLDVDLPQVRLLEVLVERIDVVFVLVALFFFRRLRIGRREQQRGAVRHPLDVRHLAGVAGQRPGLAAVGGKQINLLELVLAALGDERNRAAVRRPARRAFVLGAVRQLDRCAAVDAGAPDVRDPRAAFPVRVAAGEEHVAAVGRDARVRQARHAQQIDNAQRARRLRRRLSGIKLSGCDDDGCEPQSGPAGACHRSSLVLRLLNLAEPREFDAHQPQRARRTQRETIHTYRGFAFVSIVSFVWLVVADAEVACILRNLARSHLATAGDALI